MSSHRSAQYTEGPYGPEDIERTSCPLCKADDFSPRHGFGPFSVGRCNVCGLFYLNPRLKEAVMRGRYSEGTYFIDGAGAGYEDYRVQETSLRLTFRRFLGELQKRAMAQGRLLEIGSGFGYFLDEARSFFPSVTGIELSGDACLQARNVSGAEVLCGDISIVPEEASFDTIVASNVIEHVYDPVAFLLSVRRRLGRGGAAVIATPDFGSFWYALLGKRWPSFKVPEHVTFFTEKTLSEVFRRAGYRDVRPIPFPHAFPLGLVLSKLGIRSGGSLRGRPLWVPSTMVALSAAA